MCAERERIPKCPAAARNIFPRLLSVGEEPTVDGALQWEGDHNEGVDRKDWIVRVVVAVIEAVAYERKNPHEHIDGGVYEHVT